MSPHLDHSHGPVQRPGRFLRNGHLQTMLGHFLHGPAFVAPTRRHRIDLPDGDAMVLHDSTPPRWRHGDPAVLLIHGMGGSHASPFVQRMARPLFNAGWRIFRLDLRGAGAGWNLARIPYNAGCSADARAAVERCGELAPGSPLSLVGCSLGGNIVLKMAGETAWDKLPQLRRVAAVNPPIDLEACSNLIGQPHNRIYELSFLRDLMAQVKLRSRAFPELPRVRFPQPMTLRRFDDLYTAPLSGYRDASDYYRRASSAPYISRIEIPTLILTARDDPFIAVPPFEALPAAPHRVLDIAPFGGHVGFLDWRFGQWERWGERRVVSWLLGE